ncbi:MAG: hypothetical protein ACKVHA_09890, partial [Fidelibacterota bacterium]
SHHDADIFTTMVGTENGVLGVDIGLSDNMELNKWYKITTVYDGSTLSTSINNELKGEVALTGKVQINQQPIALGE